MALYFIWIVLVVAFSYCLVGLCLVMKSVQVLGCVHECSIFVSAFMGIWWIGPAFFVLLLRGFGGARMEVGLGRLIDVLVMFSLLFSY